MATYFITGASRGIGAQLKAQLESQGHTVFGTSTSGGVGLLKLDVCNEDDWKQVVAQLEGAQIDVVVANAGVYLDTGTKIDSRFDIEAWRTTLDVNVTGAYMTAKYMLAHLRTTKGKLAFISSQMASHNRAPGGNYAYRASKAAVLNIGRNLSTDLKSDEISVGIYDPGWTSTDMGGPNADITPAESAAGLIAQFDALSLDTSGCFKRWNGDDHPY